MTHNPSFPSRPQRVAKTYLEPGDGGHVRPRRSVKDSTDAGVPDACISGYRAEALAVDGVPQVQGEFSGDLGDRVGTRGGRPVDRVRPWEWTRRHGHDESVNDLTARYGGARRHYMKIGGYNNHVADVIDEYEPQLLASHWLPIRSYVQRVARDAEPTSIYTAQVLLSVVTWFVHYCRQTLALELVDEELFNLPTIDDYLEHGCAGMSNSTKSNYRGILRAVAEDLGTDTGLVRRRRRYERSQTLGPYTDDELNQFRLWADGQPTVRARQSALALISLGAGCGLAAKDIMSVRYKDVRRDDIGVLVHVGGPKERVVPVLWNWEEDVAKAAEGGDPDEYIFRHLRVGRSQNAVGNFITRSKGLGLRPRVGRLRATWIVHQLESGTPFHSIMSAAGVDGINALARYAEFLTQLEPAEERIRLRKPDA